MTNNIEIKKYFYLVVCLSEPSSREESKLPDDLPTLLANLRQILLKKSETNDGIDSNTIQHIELIKSKIQELSKLPQPTDRFDALQVTLKTYINDLLSITQCLHVLSNETFQSIFVSLHNTELSLDLLSIFQTSPLYARTVCDRSFELLSSSVSDCPASIANCIN